MNFFFWASHSNIGFVWINNIHFFPFVCFESGVHTVRCMCGGQRRAPRVWLSLHHAGFGEQLCIRFGSKYLYTVSHLASPTDVLKQL